jgi:hypothetical protein
MNWSEFHSLLVRFEHAGGDFRVAVQADGTRKYTILIPPSAKGRLAPIISKLKPHTENVRELLDRRFRKAPASCGDSKCDGCYEIQPGKHIHPSRPSLSWLAWQAQSNSGGRPEQTPGPSPEKQIAIARANGPCVYDWRSGERGRVLVCQIHSHESGAIFRFVDSKHDVLEDLKHLRKLTGQAAADAVTWSEKRVVA